MKITIYKKEKVERATCVTMIAPVQVAVNRGKKKNSVELRWTTRPTDIDGHAMSL